MNASAHESWPDAGLMPDRTRTFEDIARRRAKSAVRRARKAGRTCHYCGSTGPTDDHVIPKSRGGSMVVPACNPCNNQRGDLPYPGFALAAGVAEKVVIATMREAFKRTQRCGFTAHPIDADAYWMLVGVGNTSAQ